MSIQRPSTEDIVKDLRDALDELCATEATLSNRKADASAARREETNAVNAHNRAQKRVDELMSQLRQTCHGDWKDRNRMNSTAVGRVAS